MRKYFIVFFLLFAGCAFKQGIPPTTGYDCVKAPLVVWGGAGENPSENDLWKCKRWILKAQEIE